MFGWYPIQDPQRNLKSTVSQMRRSSSRIAPVSATHQTSSTKTHQSGSSDISYDINTGVRSRWFRPALRSPPPETSPGRCYATDRFRSRSSANDMQILHEIWILSTVNPDSKMPRIDRPVFQWICATVNTASWHVYGWNGNKVSLEPLEKPTLGLSVMA